MRLIFFRHGIAQDKLKNETELSDYKRELTKDGQKQTKKIEKHLHQIFKGVDVFLSSPYLRAVATAEILHAKNKGADFQIYNSLDSEVTPEELIRDIKSLSEKKTYCFIGHEPQLSHAVSQILGQKDSSLKLDKSGVIVLEGDSFSELQLVALISPQILIKK
jgi:phosphohistidine phosphatase SixA